MVGFLYECVVSGCRADGGALVLSRRVAGYQLSVFTAPTPFQSGSVDVSVLVQDVATGELVRDAQVVLFLVPCGHHREPIERVATTEAATNKLLKAAVFDLPEPGCWSVQAIIKGTSETARLQFELDAMPGLGQWPALWPWIGWPVPVIVLFTIHQVLIWLKQRQTS